MAGHEMQRGAAAPAAGFTYTVHGPDSGQVIDLRQPQQVSAWTHALGCSEERLRLAIAAVGPELEEVCNHLGTVLPARPLQLVRGNSTSH